MSTTFYQGAPAATPGPVSMSRQPMANAPKGYLPSQAQQINGMLPSASQSASLYQPLAMPQVQLPNPDQMAAPDTLSSLMTSLTGGNSSLGTAAGGNGTGNVGQYTTGITGGQLPDSAIQAATTANMKPAPNPFGGQLAQQLNDFTGATQATNNVDLGREAAGQQAAMNLKRQTAQANAGLNWGDLLQRLNQTAVNTKNAITQPLVGAMLNQL